MKTEPLLDRRVRIHAALGDPARFNAMVAQAMAEVGRIQGRPAPAIGSLVVAGHSRAYDLL